MLGLVKPCKPVSFGLLSRSGSLSLVLPGWGLVSNAAGDAVVTKPTTPSATGDVMIYCTLVCIPGGIKLLAHILST